jgi:hypothetical protein
VAPLGDGSTREELSIDGGGSCDDDQAGAGSEREELSVDPHCGQHDRNGGGGVAQATMAGSSVEHGLDPRPIRAGSGLFCFLLTVAGMELPRLMVTLTMTLPPRQLQKPPRIIFFDRHVKTIV